MPVIGISNADITRTVQSLPAFKQPLTRHCAFGINTARLRAAATGRLAYARNYRTCAFTHQHTRLCLLLCASAYTPTLTSLWFGIAWLASTSLPLTMFAASGLPREGLIFASHLLYSMLSCDMLIMVAHGVLLVQSCDTAFWPPRAMEVGQSLFSPFIPLPLPPASGSRSRLTVTFSRL